MLQDERLKDMCIRRKEKLEKITEDFFTNDERHLLYLG